MREERVRAQACRGYDPEPLSDAWRDRCRVCGGPGYDHKYLSDNLLDSLKRGADALVMSGRANTELPCHCENAKIHKGLRRDLHDEDCIHRLLWFGILNSGEGSLIDGYRRMRDEALRVGEFTAKDSKA